MKLLPATAALLLPLVLQACVLAETTDGTALPPGPIEQIVPGTSTRADVTRLLGPPDEVIYSNRALDPLFEQAYRYRRTRTKQTALFLLLFSSFKSDSRLDHFMVFFDESGVVEHVGTLLDREDAEYGLAF
ncbi:MAG: hypothetical protein AAF682_17400 [Planctomycetota bacterium]